VNQAHKAADTLTQLLNSIDPSKTQLVEYVENQRRRLRSIAEDLDVRLQKEPSA
jgi:hypothetical protein